MRFDILTIFPRFFGEAADTSAEGEGIFGTGILRRALRSGLVEAAVHDLRQFTTDKHRTVDDRPFGGGEGMVLKPEPFARALQAIGVLPKERRSPGEQTVLLLGAGGMRFNHSVAEGLARTDRIVLLCGRYEGVDERVHTVLADAELSVGDYVLSGGELAAAIVMDAVARLVPGVLGNAASRAYESFGAPDTVLATAQGGPDGSQPPRATHGAGGLLDYPQYTRPVEWDGWSVPPVLLSGNHEEVRRWRRRRALAKTLRQRPDLLADAALSQEDRQTLESLRRDPEA